MRTLLAVCTLLQMAAPAVQGGAGSAVPEGSADIILYNGRILTLSEPEPNPAPSALGILGERIAWLGADPEVLAHRGAGTLAVDLAGAVVVPGFCDAHAHLYGLGKALAEIDLAGTCSAEECVARVRQAALASSGDAWLQGRGWDQNDWVVPEFPHRALLDAAVPGRAVLLRRVDGHAAWVSSEALRRAGITATTPDTAGGRILRDEAGEPTGVLVDNAVDLVRAVIPPVAPAELRRRVRLAVDHCLRHGLTAVHEAGVPAERLALYEQMAADGELDLRLYCMLEDDPATLDTWLARGPFRSADGLLNIRSVKLYADGALGSRGALLLADYSDDPGNHGLQLTPSAHLLEVARRAGRAGFQVCTHAIGDGANRLVLDIYEQVLGELDLRGARWRVEHAQILNLRDLARFAALGIIASMQPVHCTSDMDWVEARLGPDRSAGGYVWRSLLESGAHLCFGTDFPVEDVDPLAGLYAARTRQHPDGTPPGGWHPEQCLDGRTALRLYTAGGAYAAFQEDQLGEVAPGRLADLTVLTEDPTAVVPAELLKLRPLLTVVAGRIRFDGRELVGP
jgi:predicted amidohydrolase YtcJ